VGNMPIESIYLEGTDENVALILCHGQVKHPDWKVVDPLRKSVSDHLGWHTLSLQIPTPEVDWLEYTDVFPAA